MFFRVSVVCSLVFALVAFIAIAAAQVPIPELLSPEEGAVLDNGRITGGEGVLWEFDWADCDGAAHYHLYVFHLGSAAPAIDRSDLTRSFYRFDGTGVYIADVNRFDWTWKVQVEVDGVWGDWSPVRTFDVEPVNTDIANVFPDVPNNYWALNEIMAAYVAGIVGGYSDGTYRPSLPVTRDQMAVFVARALAGGDAGVPAGPGAASFPDVATDYWAYKYVEYAKTQGVVGGYADGTYRPALPVDRGQMAVFVARAMAGGDSGVPAGPALASFPDVPTAFWAFRYVEYLWNHDVISGYPDGTYQPTLGVTRDQMAVYVQRAFHLPT